MRNLGIDEGARLEALRRYGVLDTGPEPAFDEIVRMAMHALDMPIAAIVLLDEQRAWRKAGIGMPACTVAREGSFSQHVIDHGAVLIIEDASVDLRFSGKPVVAGAPHIRMWAGAPLVTPDGHDVGVVFVADTKPGTLTGEQREMLDALAQLTIARLELRYRTVAQAEAEGALKSRERRFTALVENVADAIALVGTDGMVTFVSEGLTEMLGYCPADGIIDPADFVHPDDLAGVRAGLPRALSIKGDTGPFVFRARHADTSWRYIEAVANNLCDDPDVGALVVTARDVTGRERAAELVADEVVVLDMIMRGAPLDDVLHALVDLVEAQASPALISIRLVDRATGRLLNAAAPNLPSGFVQKMDPVATDGLAGFATGGRREAPQVIADMGDQPSVIERYRELARRFGFEVAWGLPILSSATAQLLGTIAFYQSPAHEPTEEQLRVSQMAVDLAAIAIERHQAEEDLVRRGLVDALTGLPNRAHLLHHVDEALQRAREANAPPSKVAVLVLDIDRFALLNDRLGHETADAVLVAAGDRLLGAVRPGDLVGRIGGDEFVVVCEGLVGEVQAVGVADRLALALRDPMDVGGHAISLTVSIGIAVTGSGHERADVMLRDADTALYRAKERGRGRCEVFTEATRRRALARAQIEHELGGALDRGELELWYQPAVSLPDGAMIGVEALLRWQHPTRGLVSPAEFIPTAEDTGLIVPIGEWVLREACAQARAWRDADGGDGAPLTMAVNLSARQVAQPDIVHVVAAALEDSGLEPAALCLEITESALMEDADMAIAALRRLKGLGVRISIDDFGTGYSSLTYLRLLPVDIVKVDRSFIDGLGRQAEDAAIVTAVLGMAAALGLETVAEGVETDMQRHELERLSCQSAQGFLFGRPAPPGVDEPTLTI